MFNRVKSFADRFSCLTSSSDLEARSNNAQAQSTVAQSQLNEQQRLTSSLSGESAVITFDELSSTCA